MIKYVKFTKTFAESVFVNTYTLIREKADVSILLLKYVNLSMQNYVIQDCKFKESQSISIASYTVLIFALYSMNNARAFLPSKNIA